MANYSKSTNFAVKDSLTTGDPNKIVSGTEIDTEFNSLASMSSTKADKVGSATAGNLATLTASGGIQDSGNSVADIAARAFVNFNGITVTVRESKNVSSVTRNSTGNFTINFDEAIEDADFIAVGNHDESNAGAAAFRATNRTASSFSVRTEEADFGTVNPTTVEVVFFK